MANKEDYSLEPELPAISGSEIEALIDVSAVGSDGICRPVFINQFQEEILALTYEDTKRLHEFLGLAIQYIREYREKTLQ